MIMKITKRTGMITMIWVCKSRGQQSRHNATLFGDVSAIGLDDTSGGRLR